MIEDFQTQYDVTKKTKLRLFYESYKILIFSLLILTIISFVSFNFYAQHKEKKKILISEKFFQAKVYIENKDNHKAVNTLKEIIFDNDATYSTLSLFIIINQNLIGDREEILSLFDHILSNNKHEKEMEDLIIYKKALFNSSFVDEIELLKTLKPILANDNLWRPHALILLGDYFVSKNEYIKAIEFYQDIFLIPNLTPDLYNYARSQLIIISNE